MILVAVGGSRARNIIIIITTVIIIIITVIIEICAIIEPARNRSPMANHEAELLHACTQLFLIPPPVLPPWSPKSRVGLMKCRGITCTPCRTEPNVPRVTSVSHWHHYHSLHICRFSSHHVDGLDWIGLDWIRPARVTETKKCTSRGGSAATSAKRKMSKFVRIDHIQCNAFFNL
jgi:hypothetical protein